MGWYAVVYGNIDFYKSHAYPKSIVSENWSVFVVKFESMDPQNQFSTAVAKAAA